MLFFYLFVIFDIDLTSIKLLFFVKSYIFIYAKRLMLLGKAPSLLLPVHSEAIWSY